MDYFDVVFYSHTHGWEIETGIFETEMQEESYIRRFKSIENARQLAGVYEIVDQKQVEEFKKKPKKMGKWAGITQFNWLKNKN